MCRVVGGGEQSEKGGGEKKGGKAEGKCSRHVAFVVGFAVCIFAVLFCACSAIVRVVVVVMCC